MLDLSIVLPFANDAARLARRVPELVGAMYRHGNSFEIVAVDAGSTPAEYDATRVILRDVPQARLLRLAPCGGLDAALTMALSALAGEAVVVMPADLRYVADDITLLTERLARCDLVFARRRQSRAKRYVRGVWQAPRRWLCGTLAHDPTSGFWAARREAVSGLQLFLGQSRYVAEIVASRGFRVGEVYVEYRADEPASRIARPLPGPLCLLATAWQMRHVVDATGSDVELLDAPQVSAWRVNKSPSALRRLDGHHAPAAGALHPHSHL
ncbi:MAG: glycosyltransferase [Pirellulales bacterium]|nr:glycosyltransferase [Pirellulales bacterium]